MTDYTYDSLQASIDDQARSALATMSPPMRQALAQVAGGDTEVHGRELASLTHRGLIIADHPWALSNLGWHVYDLIKAND